MAKTEKELNELKERLGKLGNELSELDENELDQVTGGAFRNTRGNSMPIINPTQNGLTDNMPLGGWNTNTSTGQFFDPNAGSKLC